MINKSDAIEIFQVAVQAVQPSKIIPRHMKIESGFLSVGDKQFRLTSANHIYLFAIGKAASAMALEAEKILGEKITKGLVITKYHHSLPLQYCKTIEAAHPVSDEQGIYAENETVKFLQQVNSNDILICMISGGASALLADAAEGISLEDIQSLSKILLNCGANIHELNTVRKHLSVLKGGQLLRYTNDATVVSLIISDVLGNDLSVIASGLTVSDDSTFTDAWNVLEKYQATGKVPQAIIAHLQKGLKKQIPETPKQGNKFFNKVFNHLIATNSIALDAAAGKSSSLGYETYIVNDALNGEAKDEAVKFVQQILQFKNKRPACLLMGGETTVTIKGNGKGGRNQEFVLAALCELTRQNISTENFPVILSGGTDGTDGPTDAAGAVIDKDIFQRVKKMSLNPEIYLGNNDSYNFFHQTDGLLITGPTLTNVMDVVIGLV